MANGMPTRCPACGEKMHVRLLFCPACETEVQGDFLLDRILRLEAEQRAFLGTFIRCRGSLKDVGTELGISYPTARNRLDALISAMGYDAGREKSDLRMEILNRLKAGEITADEALTLLQGGKEHE